MLHTICYMLYTIYYLLSTIYYLLSTLYYILCTMYFIPSSATNRKQECSVDVCYKQAFLKHIFEFV